MIRITHQFVSTNIMEQIIAMCVSQFMIIQLNLADESLRHFTEVPDAICIFTKDRVSPRNDRI